MAIPDARSATVRRAPDASKASLERSHLALTAALYPDGEAVTAEVLDFDIASYGPDYEHAYAMIVEAVEGLVAAVYHDSLTGLDAFIQQRGLTVYPERPSTYRPAAVPSRLFSRPGLILRPVVISIATAAAT